MSSDNPYGGPPSGPYGPGPGGQPWPPQQPGPAGPPPPYGYPPPQPPPPGSGYAFGPFAGQPGQPGGPQGIPPGQPPYGNAPGPYGPGQPPSPPPKRRGKVLIIVGALVLALIVGAIAVALLNRDDPVANQPPATASQNPSGPATTAPPTSAPPPAAKASDAVVGYLEALAAGSASAALSYGVDPVSGPLLTDQVLAQSRKRAPLSGIEVAPVDDQQAQTVTAAYRLGSTAVNTVFDVVKVGDDWKLVEVVKRVDVGLSRARSVPMVVNGTKISGNTVNVLPGSYAFSTGLSTISYGSENVVLVKGPTDYVDTYAVKAQLSKSGQKAAVATAKKRYQKCLDAKSLKPKNCPFSFSSKYNYIERTIRWRQGGKDPFGKAKVSFSATVAQVSIRLNVKVSGDCTFNGGSGTCSGGVTGTGLALVTMTRKPLKARWL